VDKLQLANIREEAVIIISLIVQFHVVTPETNIKTTDKTAP
jgi:hypothetical protein